jgi:hypothetical protein
MESHESKPVAFALAFFLPRGVGTPTALNAGSVVLAALAAGGGAMGGAGPLLRVERLDIGDWIQKEKEVVRPRFGSTCYVETNMKE